eukprot:scaffold27102_cov57-Phaeocystis_antarctica.AAC.4
MARQGACPDSPPTRPFPPPPAPPATARRTAPPPRRWRSSPGSQSCRRVSSAPGRAWAGRACGALRSSPSGSWPRAASAPPPAPAAAPPRLSAAAQLQPAPPLPPAPPARPRDAERGFLGGNEGAQAHVLAAAPHPRVIGLTVVGPVGDAEVARRGLGLEQRQLLLARHRLLLKCVQAFW